MPPLPLSHLVFLRMRPIGLACLVLFVYAVGVSHALKRHRHRKRTHGRVRSHGRAHHHGRARRGDDDGGEADEFDSKLQGAADAVEGSGVLVDPKKIEKFSKKRGCVDGWNNHRDDGVMAPIFISCYENEVPVRPDPLWERLHGTWKKTDTWLPGEHDEVVTQDVFAYHPKP